MILAIHDNKTIVVVKWYKKSVTEATPKQIYYLIRNPTSQLEEYSAPYIATSQF